MHHHLAAGSLLLSVRSKEASGRLLGGFTDTWATQVKKKETHEHVSSCSLNWRLQWHDKLEGCDHDHGVVKQIAGTDMTNSELAATTMWWRKASNRQPVAEPRF